MVHAVLVKLIMMIFVFFFTRTNLAASDEQKDRAPVVVDMSIGQDRTEGQKSIVADIKGVNTCTTKHKHGKEQLLNVPTIEDVQRRRLQQQGQGMR
mmetsp:Transcript_11481/g.27451  ORF Transcript_11481/g.27451 Transcript_11481/m.27451 type:complete len:96 (+) Transcript_11481:148-435(+)